MKSKYNTSIFDESESEMRLMKDLNGERQQTPSRLECATSIVVYQIRIQRHQMQRPLRKLMLNRKQNVIIITSRLNCGSCDHNAKYHYLQEGETECKKTKTKQNHPCWVYQRLLYILAIVWIGFHSFYWIYPSMLQFYFFVQNWV